VLPAPSPEEKLKNDQSARPWRRHLAQRRLKRREELGRGHRSEPDLDLKLALDAPPWWGVRAIFTRQQLPAGPPLGQAELSWRQAERNIAADQVAAMSLFWPSRRAPAPALVPWTARTEQARSCSVTQARDLLAVLDATLRLLEWLLMRLRLVPVLLEQAVGMAVDVLAVRVIERF
jgi:hypothetical protein